MTTILLWSCVPWLLPFLVFGHEALLIYALVVTVVWGWERKYGRPNE